MRLPSSLKLLAGTALLCLSACQCGPPEPALQVLINLDADVAATCVVLDVSADGSVVLSQELSRPAGKDSFKVGMKKQQLPAQLQLIARGYTSSTGAGCDEPRSLTSTSAAVDATFPVSGVETFTLELHAPDVTLDADADGHIALAKGGDDCNDSDKAIHPGLPASCGSTLDNDCDGKIGCADSECATAVICTRPPAGLAFVTTAAPVGVNTCSAALTVEVRDASQAPVVATVDLQLSLGVIPAGGVTLFTDATCLSPVTQVTVATGGARATFHFKAATAGMFAASATLAGLPPATQTQTVTQAPVTQLAFTTAAQTVVSGACSGLMTVQTRDATGSPTSVTTAGSIALSSNQAGVAFFSDAACATALTNSTLSVAAGGSGGSFSVRATSVVPTTLTATLAGVTPATQALTVTAGPPAQLAFGTSAQGVQSGTCSNRVRVEVRDTSNNVATVAAATPVTLSMTGVAISLFSDPSCTTAITAPISLTGSSLGFYFSGTVTGAATITASATGLTSALQVENIGVGPAAKLVLSPAQTVVAGQCSAAAAVAVQDANNNPSNVAVSALAVTLGGPASGFTFYSDLGCATALTAGALSIPVGSTTATFYFRGTSAGAQDTTATAGTLTAGARTHTVNAAPPSALAFTSAAQSQPAGTCATFDLEARDSFGNPSAPAAAATITLSSAPAVTFGAVAGCAAAVTSVTLTGTTVSFFAQSSVASAKGLTATAPFGAAMQTYTVTAAAASKLGFLVEPMSASAGAAIAPVIQVAIQDLFGNTVTTSTASVTVAMGTNPGTGVLSGTQSVAAVGGVASFSTLSIDKVGAGYTLGATSATLTAAASAAFNITPGSPAALAFRVEPTAATAGSSFAPAVEVIIKDALGNTVASSTANVTLAIGVNPGGGTLAGTTTAAAVAGVASFSSLSINRSGVGYTLGATSGTLTGATSAAFDISAGVAAMLAFKVQPANAVAGVAIAPAVQVTVQDAQGNTVTSSTAPISVAISTNAGSGVLSGTASVNAAGGIASFSTLSINKSGAGYTLDATSGSLAATTSAPFDITAAAAAKLAFAVQPASTIAGTALSPSPVVRVEDAFGNLTSSTASVAIALGANPGAAALSGTVSVAAVAGVATFGGLSLNKTGTGYTLVATSAPLTLATSAPFDITPGAPAKLRFSVQPTTALSTAAIAPAPRVAINDALDNLTTSTASVTIALGTNPGTGALAGTVTVAAVAGEAIFSGVSIDKVGTGYTLTASSALLTGATSTAFNITVGPPTKLVFLGSPLALRALDCSIARTVELQDAGGNPSGSVGSTVLTYSAAPGSATTAFYSDVGCTTLSTPATRTIAAGATQAAFYFSSQNATPTLTLTAASAPLTSATQTATILAANPTQLVFTTAPPTIEAGFCQALTIERQDVLDRPTSPTAATTITRASLPAAGILFFSDPGCTAPLASSFDILSSASSTVVYVKGISGSVTVNIPGAQIYGLTASGVDLSAPAVPLLNGTINVTVLPMVRRGGCTILAGALNAFCPVTPAIPGSDISRTFVLSQAIGTATNPADANVACRLSTALGLNVICERQGIAGTIKVQWETVSFAYGFAAGGASVQHASGLFTGLTGNPLNVTVAAVDLTKSFVVFSSSSSGGSNGANDFLTARLSNATTVELVQSPTGGLFSNFGGYSLQVVSLAGANVLRSTEIIPVGAASVAVSGLTAADVDRTFSLFSARASTVADDNAICKRKLRGAVPSTTGLSFRRGDGALGSCVDTDINELAWERIELPAGHTVQPLTIAHASNAASATGNVATQVDLTRSVVFMAGQGMGGQAAGESNFSSNDNVAAVLGFPSLDANGVTVTVTRAAINLGTATFTPFVVQLSP